jgi:hypothetical protein
MVAPRPEPMLRSQRGADQSAVRIQVLKLG